MVDLLPSTENAIWDELQAADNPQDEVTTSFGEIAAEIVVDSSLAQANIEEDDEAGQGGRSDDE